jgi:translocation and assembly module TamB
LNAQARYAGDHIDVEHFKLVSGATTARIHGFFGLTRSAKLDGRWSIHSSDLSTLWPTLAGSLASQGRVSGRVAAPNIQARLEANHVAAAGARVAHAGLDARVDWSGASRSKVTLAVNGIHASGEAIHKVTLAAAGTPASHHITVALDSALAKANVAADGHWDKQAKRWHFTLKQLRAAYQKLAPWHLAAPATGVVSAKAQSLGNACLAAGPARLCLRAAHDAKESQAHIKLSHLAYAYAKPLFPSGLSANGAISGTVDARVPATGAPDIDTDLHTTAGQVTMTTPASGPVRVLAMDPGHIGLHMSPAGLKVNVDLPLAQTGGINAKLAVPAGNAPLTQRPLTGTVHIRIAKLGFIQKLSPQVAAFSGHIQGDLQINGSIAAPNVLGQLVVDAPKIVLVGPGLTLTGVRLTAIGHGDSIGITAKAASGGGTLNARGAIALNASGQNIHLAIKGHRFQVVHIPDVTAYASPDLHVQVTPAKVAVTGTVTIPEASITPRNLPAAGVETVSSDQVIVTGRHKPVARATKRAIHANVKVILGKKVHIEGFGLKADLAGALRVIQQPGQQPTGAGQINIVNGSYKAYGQNLDIQQGKILFAGGPVSEPAVEIRAARYPAKDVTVGVRVRGSVYHPQVSLFSHPSMDQSEQLSWLLLGQPLNQANGEQSNRIARAAVALGSSGGNQVLNKVGQKLGLNVGIGSNPGTGAGQSSETAFTVGKYLTPKIYVSYGLGLFDQVSTLLLRYTLSSHWQLQTESSSEGTGGDVIYSISR